MIRIVHRMSFVKISHSLDSCTSEFTCYFLVLFKCIIKHALLNVLGSQIDLALSNQMSL